MKKLIIILLFILFVTNLFSQMIIDDRLDYDFIPYIPNELPEARFDKYRPYIVIGILTTSIVLEAIGDGLYDEGDKEIGKAFQILSLATLYPLIPLLRDCDKWWISGLSYMFIRGGLFDITYNATRHLPIGYIGDTSYWDKGLQKIYPPTGMQLFGRAIFLTIGFSITINELR